VATDVPDERPAKAREIRDSALNCLAQQQVQVSVLQLLLTQLSNEVVKGRSLLLQYQSQLDEITHDMDYK
jgi:hypothetical protein